MGLAPILTSIPFPHHSIGATSCESTTQYARFSQLLPSETAELCGKPSSLLPAVIIKVPTIPSEVNGRVTSVLNRLKYSSFCSLYFIIPETRWEGSSPKLTV